MSGRSLPETAAKEAVEEAGVLGRVGTEPIGEYRYVKRTDAGYDVRCHVFLYPLLVLLHRTDWREREERSLRWFPLADAAATVDDKELGRLLAKLARTGGTALRDVERRLAREAADPATVSAA